MMELLWEQQKDFASANESKDLLQPLVQMFLHFLKGFLKASEIQWAREIQ